MVHAPGIEVFFALLAPGYHLYERFFNLGEAEREHRRMVEVLQNGFQVRVDRLEEAVVQGAGYRAAIRQGLRELAERRLERRCAIPEGELPPRLRAELCFPLPLEERDSEHLFRIALLDPVLTIARDRVRVELDNPLYNLYFMRDQQVATDRGMVLGRMATADRGGEVEVSRLALRALELPIAHEIARGSLEGGDFIPAGAFALVGCGPRTSEEGVQDLLAHGLSFEEVAVVHAPRHPLVGGFDPMVAMHLDTYFNVAAPHLAVGSPVLLEGASVEVYRRDSDGYVREGAGGSLREYVAGKGFELIEISTLEQLCYATNFLCIREGVCVSPDSAVLAPMVLKRLQEKADLYPKKYGPLLAQAERDYARLRHDAEFFPHKADIYAHGLDMTPLLLTNATGGYGGAHCMTCVIRRG